MWRMTDDEIELQTAVEGPINCFTVVLFAAIVANEKAGASVMPWLGFRQDTGGSATHTTPSVMI